MFFFSRFFFVSDLSISNAAFNFLTDFNIVSTEPMSAQWLNNSNNGIVDFEENISINTELLLHEYDDNDLFQENKEANFSTYLFFKKPSFISFFINNLIDVPICFKKSRSLRRKNFELPLLKICSLLMKKGKKEKTIKLFFTIFRTDSLLLIENFPLFSINFFWIQDYLLLINRLFVQNENTLLLLRELGTSGDEQNTDLREEGDELPVNNEKNLRIDDSSNVEVKQNEELIIKNKILKSLSFVSPVFAYFIYSVDKNIRKFSRGKSGKYRFVWKYVAPYKRPHVVLKWLVKEIKFINEKTFQKRLTEMFLLLKHFPETSFTWKSKNFSHNYVFRNFKKTLMTHLKTIS